MLLFKWDFYIFYKDAGYFKREKQFYQVILKYDFAIKAATHKMS